MRKPARITVLCEDLQQLCFIRRFLNRRGWKNHDINVPFIPSGGGSGEQYVREQFPGELEAYRSQASYKRTGLIVVIDADTQKVTDRVRAFDSACKGKGVEPRQKNEKVLYVIPKRNIETWLAYLRGETVDEETDKKRLKHVHESGCHAEADKLDTMCKAGKLDPVPPPSLERCCVEFQAFWCLIQ
jgi:hypothetical protein